MGNEAKWEYFRVMYERYHKAERKARAALLDEFCVTTRYNRKYAIRLLNGPRPEKERVRRPRERKPQCGKQVIGSGRGVGSGGLSRLGIHQALLGHPGASNEYAAGDHEGEQCCASRPRRASPAPRVPTQAKSKYSVLHLTKDAPLFKSGSPCTCTLVLQLLSSMGVYVAMPTFTMPGSSSEQPQTWSRS